MLGCILVILHKIIVSVYDGGVHAYVCSMLVSGFYEYFKVNHCVYISVSMHIRSPTAIVIAGPGKKIH